MAAKYDTDWIDRAIFNDVVSAVDAQWVRDIYDAMTKDGYDEEVVLDLVGDLLMEPDMLYKKSIDTNPFYSEDKALKSVLDEFVNLYQNKKKDEKAQARNMYRFDALRDKMKTQANFPFLNPDVLNNGMFTTHLNDTDEQKFRNWYSGYSDSHGVVPDPDDPENYYDARGWWKDATDQERFDAVSDPNAHLSDRYKMPGHPTFSDESRYHDPGRPETTGGHWNEYGFFRPSDYQRSQPGRYISDPIERKIRQRYTESAFEDDAYNTNSHARGAFQIAPSALKDYVAETGRSIDLNNPRDNEEVRNWYMDKLPLYMAKDVYYEDEPEWNRLAKIYAAYNWGAGNLNNYLREAEKRGIDIHDSVDWVDGLNEETRNYVNFNVLGNDVTDRLNTRKFDAAVSRWQNR